MKQQKIASCVSVAVKGGPAVPYFPIPIPTNQSFVLQWHKWIYKTVLRHFKRNKERAEDTVQNAIKRLLEKDAIGRWLFKHLSEELVDRPEAERILGLTSEAERAKGVSCLEYISQIVPVHGERGSPNSLWRIKDLLNYGQFDYERYYYSIQGHTIDTEKVLRLMGYKPTDVSVLESMYRQGRIKPAELTEHHCVEQTDSVPDAIPHVGLCMHEECANKGEKNVSLGFCNRHSQHRQCAEPECGRKHFSRGYCNVHYSMSRKSKCAACAHGRATLAKHGLSLTHRWNSPESIGAAMKLRWNDNQLREFLRDWRRQNIVRATPRHIMRLSPNQGVDAGLLAYMRMIVDNSVVNEFKTLTRSDDLEHMVFNDGMSPEFSNDNTVGWENSKSPGSDEKPEKVICDMSALSSYSSFEHKYDADRLAAASGLSEDEMQVITGIDLSDEDIKDYSDPSGRSTQQLNRVRASAIAKMKSADDDGAPADALITVALDAVCKRHGVTPPEVFGPGVVGSPVAARTDFIGWLSSHGMGAVDIAARYSLPLERVRAAIARAARRPITVCQAPQALAAE